MPEFSRYVIRWASPARVQLGLAAYDTFTEALERDKDFPRDNPDVLAFRCMLITNDGIMIMECKRETAARFLKNMADEGFPNAQELRRAADEYTQEARIRYKTAGMAPWTGSPEEDRMKIADPMLLQELSRLIQKAKVHEERAVEHL